MFAIGFSISSAYATKPDSKLTPGELCTPNNSDFAGYRYPAHIAYCKRNVTIAMKLQVAQAYGGISQSDWPKYEFDHLIPLGIGGANSIHNVWPQLKNKDQELKNNLEITKPYVYKILDGYNICISLWVILDDDNLHTPKNDIQEIINEMMEHYNLVTVKVKSRFFELFKDNKLLK